MAKKLTNYILDLGRVIAYYPNLKKLTGSTTATILLCQFLYWTDKAKEDSWIYKTADEIEAETGLSYCEQKTAKDSLVELGLLEYEIKRLDHTTRYRVNQEELNDKWEEISEGKQVPAKKKEKPEPKYKVDKYVLEPIPGIDEKVIPVVAITSGSLYAPTGDTETSGCPLSLPPRTTAAKKKGDWLDMQLEFNNSPAGKLEAKAKEVKEKIETQLAIRANGDRWLKFIKFAASRDLKNEESIDKFLAWAVNKGFDPIYWTPEKLETLWPQAFVDTSIKPSDDFCPPMPKVEEKKYVPMPRYTPNKRD